MKINRLVRRWIFSRNMRGHPRDGLLRIDRGRRSHPPSRSTWATCSTHGSSPHRRMTGYNWPTHSLDRGRDSVLITKSGAELSQAGNLNPLPDSGFFAANDEHPDVQLPYGTAGDGPQVHQSADKTETYSFPVPANHYAQLQLFFISAAGPTPVSIKLQYADGSSGQRATVVTDFWLFCRRRTSKTGLSWREILGR